MIRVQPQPEPADFDERVRDLDVEPHDLADYDDLAERKDDEHDDEI